MDMDGCVPRPTRFLAWEVSNDPKIIRAPMSTVFSPCSRRIAGIILLSMDMFASIVVAGVS